ILQSNLLPFEKPFLLSHEWGHLAGFADESEASFVGLLSCIRSDMVAIQYSGWLALYEQIPWPVTVTPDTMKEPNNPDLPPKLAPEVIADLRAINERVTRGRIAAIDRVQWKMYDRFLKANHVQAGIMSYDLLVQLMLGTRFESDWLPERRPAS